MSEEVKKCPREHCEGELKPVTMQGKKEVMSNIEEKLERELSSARESNRIIYNDVLRVRDGMMLLSCVKGAKVQGELSDQDRKDLLTLILLDNPPQEPVDYAPVFERVEKMFLELAKSEYVNDSTHCNNRASLSTLRALASRAPNFSNLTKLERENWNEIRELEVLAEHLDEADSCARRCAATPADVLADISKALHRVYSEINVLRGYD